MGNRKDHQQNEPLTQGQEEVRDSKHDRGQHQKGPQAHAEGQHGDKTHARLVEQLHEGRHEESREARLGRDRQRAGVDGERRLVEDRQQHDEAEKNSEHNRLFIEHERGRDDGPSDNRGSLHGVLDHREHRADYQQHGRHGLKNEE